MINMNNYVCEKCGASFTRTYSLLRHSRESCRLRFADSDVGKRRRIDGAASSSTMEHCVMCNINVPKNKMLAHQRTLQHKSKSCVTVSHGVQLIQSAFKNRLVTYRISSDNEHVDYIIFFDEIKSKVLPLISEVLQMQNAIKVNMVVVGRYFLPSQDTFSEKTFNTLNEIVTVGSDLNDIYHSLVEAMKAQSTEFQEKDSGMEKKYTKINISIIA